MAYHSPLWYEELPTPWDMDCRGKFTILKTIHPLNNRDNSVEAKYEFFKRIREKLEETGKFDFLRENGIDIRSLKVTGCLNQACRQIDVAVLIDLPRDLRTMYALRFTE